MSAINASGFVGGTVFLNPTGNAANESIMHGVTVVLTGTTTGATPTTVKLADITDIKGNFSFRNLLPGTYSLKANPVSALVNPSATLKLNFTLTSGQKLDHENLTFNSGLNAQAIFSTEFLDSSSEADFPFGTAGTPADNAPIVSHALGTVTLPENTTGKVTDLAGFFTDPDFTNSQVRFNITAAGAQKTLTLNMFDATAPQTVTNFFDYINAGNYNNSIFNRLTSTATNGLGVLQGGAVTLNGTGNGFNTIPIGPFVPNEFGVSNTQGTIAMAQQTGNSAGATPQFFFNDVNNASSLDSQKFTVFGQLDAASETVLTSLAATPVKNLTNPTLSHDFPTAGFNEIPVNNYTGSAATFPGDATSSNFIVINSIDVLKRSEALTYSIVSVTNSTPGLVSASLNNEYLTLNAAPGKTGTAQIRLRATDMAGEFVDQIMTVKITAAPTVNSVHITPNNAANIATITAAPVSTPATGVTFTYQWLQNGFPISPTAIPSATTATLTLPTGTSIKAGDTFSVKVTPTQTAGTKTTVGATFTSGVVTITSATPGAITATFPA